MNTSDMKTDGIELAKKYSYDGLAILRVARYALEDANFHHESKQVQEMINRIHATSPRWAQDLPV